MFPKLRDASEPEVVAPDQTPGGEGAKRCADAKNTKPDTHISLIEPER